MSFHSLIQTNQQFSRNFQGGGGPGIKPKTIISENMAAPILYPLIISLLSQAPRHFGCLGLVLLIVLLLCRINLAVTDVMAVDVCWCSGMFLGKLGEAWEYVWEMFGEVSVTCLGGFGVDLERFLDGCREDV